MEAASFAFNKGNPLSDELQGGIRDLRVTNVPLRAYRSAPLRLLHRRGRRRALAIDEKKLRPRPLVGEQRHLCRGLFRMPIAA